MTGKQIHTCLSGCTCGLFIRVLLIWNWGRTGFRCQYTECIPKAVETESCFVFCSISRMLVGNLVDAMWNCSFQLYFQYSLISQKNSKTFTLNFLTHTRFQSCWSPNWRPTFTNRIKSKKQIIVGREMSSENNDFDHHVKESHAAIWRIR